MAFPINKKLTGLVAAVFTPFTPEGEINLSVIGPYIDYLVQKQGVYSVFVNGTTGECMSLTTEERKKLAAEWCLRGKNKLTQIIVHVGCFDLKDSQDLARHAAEIGADGIAAIAPSFFKSVSVDGVQRYLQEVAAAAPKLPFYYYHVPVITGISLKAYEVLSGIEKCIPSFSGVKFSSTDLMDFGQCVSRSPSHWPMLYGVDEQLLSALVMGASGAVGSTYNYMGHAANKLLEAFNKGDGNEARIIQMQSILNSAGKNGFHLPLNKKVMAHISGLTLGPPRLPLLPCSNDHVHSIAEQFEQVFRELQE